MNRMQVERKLFWFDIFCVLHFYFNQAISVELVICHFDSLKHAIVYVQLNSIVELTVKICLLVYIKNCFEIRQFHQ